MRVESSGPGELAIVARIASDGVSPAIVRWEVGSEARATMRERHGLTLLERGSAYFVLRLDGLAPGRSYWYRVHHPRCARCCATGRAETAPYGVRRARFAAPRTFAAQLPATSVTPA